MSRYNIQKQVASYYDFCQQVRHMTRDTMLSKTYAINDFVKSSRLTDLHKISNQDIYHWINLQTERGNSGRSINDRLAHLKAMLRWQKDMNLEMPKLKLALIVKVVEAPPRKNFFSRHQIEQVLAQANQLEWLLISLAFDCGLRISELRHLQLTDIEEDRVSIIGKGLKRRYAYLRPEVRQQLTIWIKNQEISNYLWPSPLNPEQPLAVCTIRKYMQKAFLRAGVTDFCPHDLRHSYATDLKQLGVSTRQIQAGLGHASEVTTERYLSDLDGFNLREIYNIKYQNHACGKPRTKLPKLIQKSY